MINSVKKQNPEDHAIFSEDLNDAKNFSDANDVSQQEQQEINEQKEKLENERNEAKSKLIEQFAKERETWTNRVKDYSKRLGNINKLPGAQIDIYSAKQELIEYFHYLKSLLLQKNKEYRKVYKQWYKYYSVDYDIRFPKDEVKTLFIKTKMEEILEIKDELENHLKFIERTISSIENLAFGIKYRIEMEDLTRKI